MGALTAQLWRFANASKFLNMVLGWCHLVPLQNLQDEATLYAREPVRQRYWPSISDLRYFDSELRMAFTYLHLAYGAPPATSRACADRAWTLYHGLSEWLRINGGHCGCERELQRLRWHLGKLPHEKDEAE